MHVAGTPRARAGISVQPCGQAMASSNSSSTTDPLSKQTHTIRRSRGARTNSRRDPGAGRSELGESICLRLGKMIGPRKEIAVAATCVAAVHGVPL